MLDRLVNAWQKPYVTRGFRAGELSDALVFLRERATFVVPSDEIRDVADDEEDDVIISTAVTGRASHLVTGDRGLLAPNGRFELVIRLPADVQLLLEGEHRPSKERISIRRPHQLR